LTLRLVVLSNKESGGGAFVRWLREAAVDIEILHDRQLCQSETDTNDAISHIRSLNPDLIMVRALPPVTPDERTTYHRFQRMCHTLSETLVFFDPPDAWELEYDKARMHKAFEAAGLPLPETRLVSHFSELDKARLFATELGYGKVLVKPNRGADGRGVAKPTSEAAFDEAVTSILSSGDQAIAQRYIETEQQGVSSLRIMCVGTEVVLTMYCKDFDLLISNSGPELKILSPSDELRQMSETVAAVSGLNFSGIDFLQDLDGKYWVIENNSSPSFRILIRSGTDLNPMREKLLSKCHELAGKKEKSNV